MGSNFVRASVQVFTMVASLAFLFSFFLKKLIFNWTFGTRTHCSFGTFIKQHDSYSSFSFFFSSFLLSLKF